MSDIKLPIIKVSGANAGAKFNQSSLLAYMGKRGYRKSGATSKPMCQGIPILGYLDIFKNYFANTQEDKFYTIGSGRRFTITINDIAYPITDINKTLQTGDVIIFTPEPTNEEQGNFIFVGSQNSRYRRWKASDIGSWTAENELTNLS